MPLVKEVRLAGSWRRIALLSGIGFSLAAWPVFMHARSGPNPNDPYVVAKKKAREDRLRWIESDEMPTK